MNVDWNKTTQETVTIRDAASDLVEIDSGQERIILGKPCIADSGDASEAGENEGWKLPEDMTKDDLFRLLSQYYDELKHRDTMFWKQVFAYFYATLICSTLPVIQPFELKIPEGIPKHTFPILGLIMAACFFFVSMAYALRLECISESYEKLLKMLPEDVKRVDMEGKTDFEPYRWRMAKVIPWIMFLLLCAINSILLLYIK